MFNPNDPVGKATEMAAKLFALIADEVLRNCGEEEGSQIVRKAVRRYGLMRGEAIRANILADGKELTFENAEAYSDYPPNQAWDCERKATACGRSTASARFPPPFARWGWSRLGSSTARKSTSH